MENEKTDKKNKFKPNGASILNIILIVMFAALAVSYYKDEPIQNIKGFYQNEYDLGNIYNFNFTDEKEGKFDFRVIVRCGT